MASEINSEGLSMLHLHFSVYMLGMARTLGRFTSHLTVSQMPISYMHKMSLVKYQQLGSSHHV